jgi:polyferredoxin
MADVPAKVFNDQYGLNWGDVVSGPALAALLRKPHTWSTAARRAYVLTWPVSLAVRVLLIITFMATWLALNLAGGIANRLSCVWHGERGIWSE